VISTESVITIFPFTIRRHVRFGDCDPAGVVYTVRFSDYAVSAMDLFLSHILSGPNLEQIPDVQTPIKALSFVFSAPLRPNDEFDMAVTVREIRTRTFDLALVATLPSGTVAFEALLTPICVTTGGDRRSLPIPARLQTLLEQSQERTAAHASSLPG
jgi:4-hydroxybenzoyl-CoA thioesterase